MRQHIMTLDDISLCYQEFIDKTDAPKIENLTNWGRHRLFLAKYFKIQDGQYAPHRIIVEFHARAFALDTTKAPDFLDQNNYIQWLQQQLSHE